VEWLPAHLGPVLAIPHKPTNSVIICKHPNVAVLLRKNDGGLGCGGEELGESYAGEDEQRAEALMLRLSPWCKKEQGGEPGEERFGGEDQRGVARGQVALAPSFEW
jgi:hypothetical protein